MAITRPLKITKIANVGAGQTATVGIPPGIVSIEGIGLELTDLLKTELTNIAIEIDGKPLMFFKTVADLEALSAYYGYKIVAGEVFIPFRREHMNNAAEGRHFNFGLADVETMQIRFDIAETIAGASPKVEGYALKYRGDMDEENVLGRITKIRRFVKTASGSGTIEIDDLPREAFLGALHLKSANIDKVTLEMDGLTVWEATKERMESVVERHGRVAQAGWYHMDWLLQNELGTQLAIGKDSKGRDVVSDFRLIVEMSGADTIELVPEYLSGRGGI